MTLRNAVRAGLLGPAVIALVIVALGQGPPPNFGDPLSGLTADQLSRFRAGQAAFEEEEGVADGLGPVFNDVSCVACHADPAAGGGSGARLETRFGRVVNGVFDPLVGLGGSLIQTDGIGQVGPVRFVGEVVPSQANVVAKRRTTPLFGLGLIEAVPDAMLLMVAQAQQHGAPQCAGRPNLVVDPPSAQQRVGRFGWKAQHASLLTFAGDAYLNEMGVTTPLFPVENCPQGNCALLAFDPVASPNDADNSSIQKFADFMAFLAPPPRGTVTTAARAGEAIFGQIGCATCHLPTLQTGPSPVAALSNVVFHPYSDFLLHDMGRLGDGIVQGGAGAREMRTAPLWGVRAVTALLHDGRASTLEAAILAHDGQGRPARDRFARLSPADRARLLAFLGSL